jgi:hypothetical protein
VWDPEGDHVRILEEGRVYPRPVMLRNAAVALQIVVAARSLQRIRPASRDRQHI